jgi:nitrile hydratase
MGDAHDHGHADPELALRVEALESLLVEKGLVDPATVDEIIRYYEQDVGPLQGARVVARAWVDPGFKRRLLADATAAVAELGLGGAEASHLVALENTPRVHNVVVCTLCSCYPWAVLGLPPAWYKSPAYRSRVVREPRRVLAEMGLALPDDVEVRVWDASAEVRYLVLPERPSGTEAWSEERLVPLVTRDAMIGTGRPRTPERGPA